MTKKHQRSAEELDMKKLFLFSFIPSIKKDDDECTESFFVEVNAQIEHEHLVNPAVYNPPEMSHPDEYKTILVDAHTTIEFDDDEVQPNTDKDWISYLNKHSSSITWYFNDEYSDL